MNGPDGKSKPGVERMARLTRQTAETQIELELNLDGSGKLDINSGVPFFDHLLTQVAVHGLFDIRCRAEGDLQIDPHHTVEDVSLVLGEAFQQALGDRRGIIRCGWAYFPMDDSLARVVVDFSGRPYAVVQADFKAPLIGSLPTSLIAHSLYSLAVKAGCNLHVALLYSQDDHHGAEAMFKALGRALRQAVALDVRRGEAVPSSKGALLT